MNNLQRTIQSLLTQSANAIASGSFAHAEKSLSEVQRLCAHPSVSHTLLIDTQRQLKDQLSTMQGVRQVLLDKLRNQREASRFTTQYRRLQSLQQ